MLRDSNEIMRVLLGRLIHVAWNTCDLEMKQMFPESIDEAVYEHFPSTLDVNSWIDDFDIYIADAVNTAGATSQ